MSEIILNQIQCLNCKTILISHYRHDFNCCGCDFSICVDGGFDYLKRSGSNYIEQSVYSDEPFEVIRKSLWRVSRGKDGNEKLKYVLLKDMTNSHLSATINYIINEEGESSIFLSFYQRELLNRNNGL